MKLFIGLGNPGKKYDNNRHNFGFMVLDEIAIKLKATSWIDKFDGLYAKTEAAHLLKPQSFMNNSGIPSGQLASFFKINIEDIYVFHDELDLELGKVKIKQGGGDGGHNGIKSLDSHMGKNYWRVRMGISHPGIREMVHSHVLSDFSGDEQKTAEKVVKRIAENIDLLIKGESTQFLTKYALKFNGQRPNAVPPKTAPDAEKI
jgi:PTH1 family peptidyl-tRNA hydrolase